MTQQETNFENLMQRVKCLNDPRFEIKGILHDQRYMVKKIEKENDVCMSRNSQKPTL
jgi:hypothetical protein